MQPGCQTRCTMLCTSTLWLCLGAYLAVCSADATTDFYAQLVSAPSKLAQLVTKKGMIPIERWDEKQFSFQPFNDWIMNSSVYHQEVPKNYPMSYPCGVWVNHPYKFIFIRNRKAASTTVMDNFDKCHYQQANQQVCMEVADAESFQKQGIDVAKAWQDYFVFSTSRNPWARAGSSYDYLSTKWANQEGPCRQPPFLAFSKDPSILGKISNLFHCFDKVGMYHDYYHTEPVAPCLTTGTGEPAVDFVIRYEHLGEDFIKAVQIINERRDPSLPLIPEPKIYWKKKGQAARSQEDSGTEPTTAAVVGHGEKYRQCGMDCVKGIGEYFKADLDLFGLELPTTDQGRRLSSRRMQT